MDRANVVIMGVLSSRKLLWAIVALFVFESSWIALSFAYPLLYDEAFHLPLIQFFGHQWSPVIFNQPHSADVYGSLTYGNASLYHYVMSFPDRLVNWLFPNKFAFQVIFLRLLNIAMVAGGLLLFSRLFRKIGIKQSLINIALLLYILIPLVPFCSATINYDNMLFPLTAWYLLLCLKVLNTLKIEWKHLSGVVLVGCLTCLVKEAFLPIFAASVVYLLVVLWRRYGKKCIGLLGSSLKSAQKPLLAVHVLLLVIFVGLFSVRFIQPIIKYGTPLPACEKVMQASRCQDYSDQIIASMTKTKNKRPQDTLPEYATMWFSSNLDTTGRVVATGSGWSDYQKPLPILNTLLFFSVIAGIGGLVYAWRSLRKNPNWYFLLTMVIVLVLVTFQYNYGLYQELHYPFAIQPRYLLNVVPIVIVMIVAAYSFIFRRSRIAKLCAVAIVLLLFTQGGGTVSYILRSKDFWYWQNTKVIRANHAAKRVLAPVVKEN